MWNFLWLLFFGVQAFGDNACIVPKAVTKGTRLGTGSAEYIDFYPGEELRLVSIQQKKKQVVVGLGESKFLISIKNLGKRVKEHCGQKICVRLKSKNQYYKSPNEFDSAGTIADGVYPVMTRSAGWYRVQANESYVWMPAAQLLTSRVDCDAAPVTEVSEEVSLPTTVSDEDKEIEADMERYRWKYGFEGGWIYSTSSKPLSNLLGIRPLDSTAVNNDAYDSPFIEELHDGDGWYVGGTLETTFWWGLKSKYSLGYRQRTIDVTARPNPNASGTVTYGDLGREEYTETFGFVYLNAFIKHEGVRFLGVQWQPGVNLGVDYALTDYSQEFLTAPSKLTAYDRSSGYDSFEFLYGVRLDATYGWATLGVMVNFTQYDMEPGLIFGVAL